MMYRWSSQPGKAIYLCYQLLATIFIRLPIWVILALPRSNRPRQKWSVWRVIGLRLTQHMIYINSQTGPLRKLPNSLAITPGVGIEGVWIHPISDKLFVGELKTAAEANGVKPVKIPGYWIHKKGSSNAFGAPPAGGEKVLLVFHGGAYIRFSGHPEDFTSSIAYGFLEKVPLVRRVFSLEYRLSKSHENPFPAALLDAIAAYDYLVKVIGYPPSDIIVAGDSAGGNISLALSRYLVEHKDYDGVPGLPFAVVLLSPWADIGTSQLGKGAAKENEVSDWVTSGKSGKYSQMVFCGSMGVDAANTNRYISPASLDPRMQVDFIGHPRTFIACGGAEFLADIIRTLRDKMVKDMGHAVGYYEAPEAFHDYCCFPLFEPERSDTFQLISDWLSGDGS